MYSLTGKCSAGSETSNQKVAIAITSGKLIKNNIACIKIASINEDNYKQ